MAKSIRANVPASAPTRYEDDPYTWGEEQVALLRAGRLTEIDAENIAEELADMGRSDLRSLRSAIGVLTMHLLKWDYQPAHRSRTWMATINEQRKQVRLVLRDNLGLKPKVAEAITDGYPIGRDHAVGETNLPYRTFPESCPYSFEEMMTRPIEYAEPPSRRKKR